MSPKRPPSPPAARASRKRQERAAGPGGGNAKEELDDATEGAAEGPHGGRPRGRRIAVWVTPEERADIERRAELAGLSLSNYLRTAGMNHPIRSTLDYQAIRELVGVAGDLGRLGGLFKLWLAERRGDGATVADVNRALREARELQDKIRGLLGRV